MANRRRWNMTSRRLATALALAAVGRVRSGPLEVSYIMAHVNDTTFNLMSQGYTGTIPTEIG